MDVKRVKRIITINNTNQSLKNIVRIVSFFLFLGVFLLVIFPFIFRYYIESKYSNLILVENTKVKFDKIVVLGAGYDIVKWRIEKAAKIYKQNPGLIVILSGADIPEEDYYETVFMDELAISYGIDKKDIQIDNSSSRTFETCNHIKSLGNDQTIYLMITQKYHLLRTLFVCREIGVQAFGMQTEDSSKGIVETLRTSDEDNLQSLIREVYALTYAIWDVVYYNLFQKNL